MAHQAQPAVDQQVITVEDAVAAVKRVLEGKHKQEIDVTPDDSFEDLAFDSLDAADLFVTLEETAGRRLDADSVKRARTVRELTAMRAL